VDQYGNFEFNFSQEKRDEDLGRALVSFYTQQNDENRLLENETVGIALRNHLYKVDFVTIPIIIYHYLNKNHYVVRNQ